jgi:hypothetical protein
MLDRFMLELSKELEMEPPFAPEPTGIYLYRLDEELAVEISEMKPQGVMLYCMICPYKKGKEGELFELMMIGNLLGQGTRGATLGLNEGGEKLTLSRNIDYPIDYATFRDLLEDFVNVVNFWHEQAQGVASSAR